MEKINQFSLQRFLLLMKRHSLMNAKTWLIGLGGISGVLIVVSLIQAYTAGSFNVEALSKFGIMLIFFGGLLITSMAYNEIHTPAKSQFYLILPATTSEKLFSHWLLTSIVYIIVAYAILSLVLGIASLLSALFFGAQMEFFNPFANENFMEMARYVVIHSVFFLGALYFRKNNLLKTLLTLFVVIMALSLFGSFVAWLVIGSGDFGGNLSQDDLNPSTFRFLTETLPLLARIAFWGLMAPFFLLVSYFKLKEREV